MNPLSDRVHFSIAFPDIPAPVVDVWQSLEAFLLTQRTLPKNLEVSQIAGHAEEYHSTERLHLTADEFKVLIAKRALDAFWVEAGPSSKSVTFRLLHAKELGRQSVLGCRIEQNAKAPNDWRRLIEGLMTLVPAIGGWQWRNLYQFWQGDNSADRFYEMRWGSVPPGFRKQYQPSIDGIGPGQTFIDVSLNPGRPKELLPTVDFRPTSEMWLGPHFWQYAKCTKEEALAADFFIEKRDTPHYLYLKCWPEPFSRPDGEQGRMQQRLWKLFFHEDCEWPPGSGTICDEPMYGPPKLMPQAASGASVEA